MKHIFTKKKKTKNTTITHPYCVYYMNVLTFKQNENEENKLKMHVYH